MALSNVPRQKLREILTTYGLGIVDDVRRCRALLLDYCGADKAEIFVLISAQEESVAEDLRDLPAGVSLNVRVAQLTQRLVQNRAIAEEAAHWAVTSWAWALGLPVTPTSGAGRDPSVGEGGQPKPASVSVASRPASAVVYSGQPSSVTGSARPISAPSPQARRGGLQQGLYHSNWASVEVFGRSRRQSSSKWRRLGATPGKVSIPLEMVIGLRTDVGGTDLVGWIKELDHAQDVVSLSLDGALTDDGVKALRALPGLTALSVEDASAVSDAGMGFLAALRQLQRLELTWANEASDRGFAHLGHLTALSHLSLAWSSVSDEGLTTLGQLARLETLVLRQCKSLHRAGLAYLRPLFRLTELSLAGDTQLRDADLAPLRLLTSLRRLNLSQCAGVSHRGLAHLEPLERLAYLDLSWNDHLGDRAVSMLRPLEHLTSLNLARMAISNGAIGDLRSMRELQHLDLGGCQALTDRGLLPLRQLKALVYLNVTGCPEVTARGLRRLQRPGLYIANDRPDVSR